MKQRQSGRNFAASQLGSVLISGRGLSRAYSAGSAELVEQERVIKRDILELIITTGSAAVPGPHIGLQQQQVTVGFHCPQPGRPIASQGTWLSLTEVRINIAGVRSAKIGSVRLEIIKMSWVNQKGNARSPS